MFARTSVINALFAFSAAKKATNANSLANQLVENVRRGSSGTAFTVAALNFPPHSDWHMPIPLDSGVAEFAGDAFVRRRPLAESASSESRQGANRALVGTFDLSDGVAASRAARRGLLSAGLSVAGCFVRPSSEASLSVSRTPTLVAVVSARREASSRVRQEAADLRPRAS